MKGLMIETFCVMSITMTACFYGIALEHLESNLKGISFVIILAICLLISLYLFKKVIIKNYELENQQDYEAHKKYL